MRRKRLPHRTGARLLELALLSGLGCAGDQEGYYGACDEPAGLALGCPLEPAGGAPLSTWDACMKLAHCGVLLPQQDQEGAASDQPTALSGTPPRAFSNPSTTGPCPLFAVSEKRWGQMRWAHSCSAAVSVS